jgi:hypothetical protein
MTVRLLLKTTIPPTEDDWHVGRFSLLRDFLRSRQSGEGQPQYEVAARDRLETKSGSDMDLESAAHGAFDQIWLIAADATGALTADDVGHLQEFRKRGGGLFLTRDHQDLGACLTRLGMLGLTQHFQSKNPEADPSRRCCDDTVTQSITWPNYHSGANGDFQEVQVVEPLHPIMRTANGAPIRRLPAHPHEGAVGVPTALGASARVIATGRSRQTGKQFNLCVAVEEPGMGRAVSDSSFHHLADYNWDPRMGAPTFVNEPAGSTMLSEPAAILDTHQYVENIAAWLGGRI